MGFWNFDFREYDPKVWGILPVPTLPLPLLPRLCNCDCCYRIVISIESTMGKNQAHAARKTNFSSGDGDGGGADFGDGMVRACLGGRGDLTAWLDTAA